MEKQYKVIGRYNGRKIDEVIYAYSPEQAKLKAGFQAGYGGSELKQVVKKLKVRRK